MTPIRTLQRANTGLSRIIKHAASGALVCTLLMCCWVSWAAEDWATATQNHCCSKRCVRFAYEPHSALKTIAAAPSLSRNYRLAHLVQGDLWSAKAKPLQSFGNAAQPFEQLVGLRAEAAARVQRENDAFKPEQVPANFWRLPVAQQYALAAG